MKKFYLSTLVALLCSSATFAQTDLISLAADATEAEELGYSQLWGVYDWGALLPANTVLYSDDEVTLTELGDSYVYYEASKGGKYSTDFTGSYLNIGTTATNFYVAENIYDFTTITNTSSGKEAGALKLEPTTDGRITIYFGTGFNNRSVIVYDYTFSDEYLTPVLVGNLDIELGGDRGDSISAAGVTDKVHVLTTNVIGDHEYYIFGTGNGVELYQITWTAMNDEDNYQVNTIDESGVDALLIDLAADATEAEELGYSQLWGVYDWGALLPANTVLYSDDDVTLTELGDSYVYYEASKGGKYSTDFTGSYLNIGTTATNFYVAENIYDFTTITNTSSGKEAGALKLEPTTDGRISLYFGTGFNNRSVIIYDYTFSDEYLTPVLVGNLDIELGGDRGDSISAAGVTDKVHVLTTNVIGGNEYYIFGTGNGVELYQIAWTAMDSEDTYPVNGYGSTTSEDTDGITTVATETVANASNVYTIDGRLMGTSLTGLSKGIYIRNGKKFVVK